jgi:HEPN domain-containing protein
MLAMDLPDDERLEFSRVRIGPVYEPVLEAGAPTGASLPITLHWLHRDLLRTAARLARSGNYQAAVVFAQTASEVQVERALAALLRRQGVSDPIQQALDDFIPNYGVHNKRQRKLWEALSGDGELTKQGFWAERLPRHIERRNAVVHRGEDVSAEEAADSIWVVLELMEHMEGVVAKLIPPVKVRRINRS